MNLRIIQTPDYILGVDKEVKPEETDFYYDSKQQSIRFGTNNTVAGGYKWKIIAHTPLNDKESLEGVPLLPDFELKGDFWENMPVRWIKWTKRKPNWNGSVYMQFNGKNQGNGLVHNGELIKLSGLANSEFKNYEDTFYWLEQDFNYYKEDYKAAGGYTENDLIKGIMMYARWLTQGPSAHEFAKNQDEAIDKIIKSLKPFPTEFEVEMVCGVERGKCDCSERDLDCQYLVPKVLNNIVQGTYKYK